jgi:hypothetical protein
MITLAIAAFLAASFNASSDDWPGCVQGKFGGELEVAGEKLKSETRFNVHDAIVDGTYSFTYKNELVEGTLSSAVLNQPRSITFRWRSKFGTGTLTATFSADCSEFSGEWRTDDNAATHSWTGKRQG